MAFKNRIVDIAYRLKDFFTGPLTRIQKGYRDVERTAQDASATIEGTNKRAAGSFGALASSLARIRTAVVGIGTATAAAGAFTRFVNQADKVGKISDKLGVSAEELTALGYAAERSNIQFDNMATALQRMLRRAAEAAKGTGEAKDALRELGIDAKAFSELSLEDKMAALADAFAAIDDQGRRVALAFKLFDAEGVDMVRILQDGSAAMRALMGEARELGKVLDDDTTAAAARFNDSLTKLSATATGYGYQLGAGILDNANAVTETLGISADQAANLRAEFERLEKATDGEGFNPFGWIVDLAEATGLSDLEGDIEDIRKELEALEETKREQAQTDEQARAAAEALKLELADQARTYGDLSESWQYNLDQRKRVLSEETAELRKAKVEQLSIEKEFQRLIDQVSAPDREDVGLGDVFGANTQARAALARGESDDAIRLAREGADLLGALKAKGSETGATLQFLAKQLQEVATQASAQQTQTEAEDVRLADGAVKTLEAQLTVMTRTAGEAGNAAGIAYAEAMQQAMSRMTLTPPPVAAAELLGAALRRENMRRGSRA